MAARSGIKLSSKFEEALSFSTQKHEGQYRKGNRAPYISHPMAVASLAMEMGGSEIQAMAALLHDVIEDCEVTEAEIAEKFGAAVAAIVVECTEKLDRERSSWRERKMHYLEQLRRASGDAILVAACDKFHNISSLVMDLQFRGESAWIIFKEPATEVRWYYQQLDLLFQNREIPESSRLCALLREFSSLVRQIHA